MTSAWRDCHSAAHTGVVGGAVVDDDHLPVEPRLGSVEHVDDRRLFVGNAGAEEGDAHVEAAQAGGPPARSTAARPHNGSFILVPGVRTAPRSSLSRRRSTSTTAAAAPPWWQLWKGLYEVGVDLIVAVPGRPIESPWWRTAPNPTRAEGEGFAAVRAGLAQVRATATCAAEDRPGRDGVRQGDARDDLALGHAALAP